METLSAVPQSSPADVHRFPTPACHSSVSKLRHQTEEHNPGPNPWSLSLPDSPCNKIWCTVSSLPLRRAKCNRSVHCSDVGSPAILHCPYLVFVWSGNPTKWLCYVTAWDNETPGLTINMDSWQHGNSFLEFLTGEGMLPWVQCWVQ